MKRKVYKKKAVRGAIGEEEKVPSFLYTEYTKEGTGFWRFAPRKTYKNQRDVCGTGEKTRGTSDAIFLS